MRKRQPQVVQIGAMYVHATVDFTVAVQRTTSEQVWYRTKEASPILSLPREDFLARYHPVVVA